MKHHASIRISISALVGIACLTFSMVTYAASGDTAGVSTGNVKINIEQKTSADDAFLKTGTWLLKKPGNVDEDGSGDQFSLQNAIPGVYTLFVSPTEGSTVKIHLQKGNEEIQIAPRPQVTFKAEENDSFKLVIEYSLTQIGKVGVQSDPPGLSFTMKGPNDTTVTGVTPATFEPAPAGLYSVKYDSPEGCPPISTRSGQLQVKGRLTLSVTLECEAAEAMRNQQEEDAEAQGEAPVSIETGERTITMVDVPLNAWFATHIYIAAKHDIITGYKDDNGNPNGLFGPGNSVTVAELVKIAHRMAGVSENGHLYKNPLNPLAQSQWFSPFFASAEDNGWVIFADGTIDPYRPATRAEVLVTLYQALDRAILWPKGNIFTDVHKRTPYAGAVETAAGEGLVEGQKNADGTPTGIFGPNDPVNRAEIAKIVSVIIEPEAVHRSADDEEEE